MSADLKTMLNCEPFGNHPEKANSAALLVHGFMGSPHDLRFLGSELAKRNIAVSAPRLPGAGTDLSDLSTTTRYDWIRRAYDAWLDLKGRYARVSIVGYSMGGLIALLMASKIRPERLVLLAPALVANAKGLCFAPLLTPLAPVLPAIKTGWNPEEEDDEHRREYGRRYWLYRDIPSAAQFHRLCRQTRRHLKTVLTPVDVIASQCDTTVPIRILDILEKDLPNGICRRLVLENCKHNIPQGPDRELVAETVYEWLTKQTDLS